jgi:capsular polysaccharide transport system ATP-binding protein
MIELDKVSKTFHLHGRRKTIADQISARFPSKTSIALLGRNGAGKSTLLNMIGGMLTPDSGTITSSGSISWPVGFGGSFHPDLTGDQNTRFIARVYGVDTRELSDFVEDFAQLGSHFRLPFRTYSSGMRSRLAFGVSIGIKFDTYLIDEVTSVGDANFKEKSKAYLLDRLENSGALVVSHSMPMIREICTAAAVIEAGKMTYFADIQEGIAQHLANMKKPLP